jgi:hypothetical protein
MKHMTTTCTAPPNASIERASGEKPPHDIVLKVVAAAV